MVLLKHQRGFASLIALAIGGIFVVGGLVMLAKMLHSAGYESGNAAAEKKWKPQVQRLTLERDQFRADLNSAVDTNKRAMAEVEKLKALHEEQRKADAAIVAALRLKQAEVELALRKALVRVVESEKRYTAEIARLAAIAAGPTITEGACDEADAILRRLARDRSVRE